MLSVTMLTVAFSNFCSECRYDECSYAECRGAFNLMIFTPMPLILPTFVHMAFAEMT